MKELQNYEFMDPDAHRLFWELMKGLQQQMLQPFLSNMQKALGNMSPQDLERMREMLRDLNRMLQDRAEGREPDFAGLARALFAAGFRKGDLLYNTFSYHFTPAGLMVDAGARALKCAVFPAGAGQTELQAVAIAAAASVRLFRWE